MGKARQQGVKRGSSELEDDGARPATQEEEKDFAGEDLGADNDNCSDSAHPQTSQQGLERRRGLPWTEDEHRLFLLGLQNLGKGDWRGISRHFVKSRTPTQVASHAQKYFIRQTHLHKRRRRSSLFDLVPEPDQMGQNVAGGRPGGLFPFGLNAHRGSEAAAPAIPPPHIAALLAGGMDPRVVQQLLLQPAMHVPMSPFSMPGFGAAAELARLHQAGVVQDPSQLLMGGAGQLGPFAAYQVPDHLAVLQQASLLRMLPFAAGALPHGSPVPGQALPPSLLGMGPGGGMPPHQAQAAYAALLQQQQAAAAMAALHNMAGPAGFPYGAPPGLCMSGLPFPGGAALPQQSQGAMPQQRPMPAAPLPAQSQHTVTVQVAPAQPLVMLHKAASDMAAACAGQGEEGLLAPDGQGSSGKSSSSNTVTCLGAASSKGQQGQGSGSSVPQSSAGSESADEDQTVPVEETLAGSAGQGKGEDALFGHGRLYRPTPKHGKAQLHHTQGMSGAQGYQGSLGLDVGQELMMARMNSGLIAHAQHGHYSHPGLATGCAGQGIVPNHVHPHLLMAMGFTAGRTPGAG